MSLKSDSMASTAIQQLHGMSEKLKQIKAGGDGSGRKTSDDGSAANTALNKYGFQHTTRHNFDDDSKVDLYSHPAGHTAAVKSSKGEVPQWSLNYGRGLGTPKGTGSSAMVEHLGKSEDFLNNEANRKVKGAAEEVEAGGPGSGRHSEGIHNTLLKHGFKNTFTGKNFAHYQHPDKGSVSVAGDDWAHAPKDPAGEWGEGKGENNLSTFLEKK